MTTWVTTENLIYYPTVVLFGVSIFFDIYVISSTFKLIGKLSRLSQATPDYVISNLIFILSFTSLLQCINDIPAFGISWHHFNKWCFITGFIGNFLLLFICLWQLLIAMYLFCLLNSSRDRDTIANYNYNYSSNKKCYLYLHNPTIFNIIVAIFTSFCLIACILPTVWESDKLYYGIIYNYTDANHHYKKYGAQCWVEGWFQLIPYIIWVASIVFNIIVLLLAICKYIQTKKYTDVYIHFVKRLITWVVLFTLLAVFPFIDRLLGIISKKKDKIYTAPLWIVLAHNYSLACVGIANGIVWYFNGKFKPIANRENRIRKSNYKHWISKDKNNINYKDANKGIAGNEDGYNHDHNHNHKYKYNYLRRDTAQKRQIQYYEPLRDKKNVMKKKSLTLNSGKIEIDHDGGNHERDQPIASTNSHPSRDREQLLYTSISGFPGNWQSFQTAPSSRESPGPRQVASGPVILSVSGPSRATFMTPGPTTNT